MIYLGMFRYLQVASVLGFACQVDKGVFPQIAPCLEHVCAGGVV